MEKIIGLKAREILDSSGIPTVEVEVETENHITAIASVPSGATVGSHEVIELRDNDENRFSGMGVLKAVDNVKKELEPALIGMDVANQTEIDQLLNDRDGTPHKSKIGANAILAVSTACCKAGAFVNKQPLYKYIQSLGQFPEVKIPKQMYNFIEGGKHADNNLLIQEFLVLPVEEDYKENFRSAAQSFQALKKILKDRGLGIAVGHEGGFAPTLPSDEDALKILVECVPNLKLGLDTAGAWPTNLQIEDIIQKYPIISLEDPLEEDNWDGWADLTAKHGSKIFIVGDDLFSTNVERLKEGIQKKTANSVVVKPNQIGTISEAIEFAKFAKENNYKVVVSHRSGETEDTFIADFAVGIAADFAKFGAPSRGERVAKYNRLLRIYEQL